MSFKNIISSNIRLKLLALALALVSWYAIRETISFEITVSDIPLDIKVDEGWSVLRQSADSVTATFRGSQEDIRLLDQKQLRAVLKINAPTARQGEDIVVATDNITGTRGVRVARVYPERVSVSLDRESERRVPVKARVAGRPFAGEIETLLCEPAIVSLRGPATHLEQTEWVFTEPVDVDGRASSFRKRCRVLPPSNLWTPRIDPPEVQVSVMIVQQTASQTWNDVAVSALMAPGQAGRISIVPSKVQVTVSGTPESVAALMKMTPRVFVDCQDLDPSLTYDLPVSIHLPAGAGVTAAAEPPVAHIVIERTLTGHPLGLPAENGMPP